MPIRRLDGSHFAVDWRAPSTPQAPVYVIVPAMGVGARFYRQFADAVADSGSGVAITELRGHEGIQPSIPGRRRDFGYADLADDLDAAIELVRERAPGSPVVVLGHSLGAQVACVSVARGRATVDALAFVAAGSIHWRLWPWRYLFATQLFAAVAIVVGHFPGRLVSFAGREARGVMRDWARLARTGRLTYGRPPVDANQELAAIELPVLVLSLHGDTLAPQRSVEGLAALVPSARVTRRHLVFDAGKRPHFGWVSRPDAVISELVDWSSTWVQLPDSI